MCDDRERLIGYVYDDCSPGERREIEAHLATCPDCRQEIAGLRNVRQDLLAWDVPDHGSVWEPFAPLRPTFSWSQVPAWAMAAAAGVILMAGAAGGVATHALLSPSGPPRVADAAPASTPTAADMTAIERRVLATMRSEMDERVRLALSHAPMATTATVTASREVAEMTSQLAQMSQRMGLLQTRINEIDQQQFAFAQSTNVDLARLFSRPQTMPVNQQVVPGAGFGR